MTIDTHGNQHRPAGSPDGGRFSVKANTAPSATLVETIAPPTCPRHGGEWGDDLACETCTTTDGDVRQVPDDLAGFTAPSDDEVRAATMSVELRSGEREVSDETARVIALDTLANLPESAGTLADYPMLQRVAAEADYPWSAAGNEAQVDELHRELGRLYGSAYVPYGRKQRVNALFTFALHGGDND